MSRSVFRFVLGLFAMSDDGHIPATRYRIKNVDTYEIPVSDFNRIKAEGSSVGTHLQFATAWLPVALTLSLTLATVPIQSIRTYVTVLVVMMVSWSMGIFHGVCAYQQRGRFEKLMEGLRQLQVGPLGEEGKELQPSELASLPGQAAQPVNIEVPAATAVAAMPSPIVSVTTEPLADDERAAIP